MKVESLETFNVDVHILQKRNAPTEASFQDRWATYFKNIGFLLKTVALHYGAHESELDDVIQDIALGVFQRVEYGSDNIGNIGGYVYRTTRNITINKIRERMKFDHEPLFEAFIDGDESYRPDPKLLETDDMVRSREILKQLMNGSLQSLSKKDQEILCLSALGLTPQEMEGILNEKGSAIRMRLKRARERLSKLLSLEDMSDL